MEDWLSIENYENYEVSSCGRIRNKITFKILVNSIKSGYYNNSIYNNEKKRKTLKVHRLVA